MPYIDLAGLSRYASRQKDRLERDYALLRDMQWLRTDKAGAVSLWPIGGTPLKPVVDFLFAETPPASGDKGPENPSTISGVSSVGVADRSKNIYDFPNLSAEPYNGVTITCDADGTITLNGTCNLSSSQSKELYYTYPVAIKTISQIKVIASIYHIGGAYDISDSDADTPVLVQVIRQSLTTGSFGYCWLKDTGTDQTSIQSWTVSNAALITCSLRFFGGAVYNNYKIKVQYEISSDSTVPSSYEPPARDAFAVLPLNGTYYGGTLDVASGVMTVTWGSLTFSSVTNFQGDNGTCVKFAHVSTTRKDTHYSGSYPDFFACSMFPVLSSSPQDVEFCRAIGSGDAGSQSAVFSILKSRLDVSGAVNPSSPTNAEWLAAINAWLAEHPVTYYFKLYYPYIVQLSPTEILSLAQADKYTPRLNTIYTDASAVQVGYVKSPIRDEYELQQAVTAQGGNV